VHVSSFQYRHALYKVRDGIFYVYPFHDPAQFVQLDLGLDRMGGLCLAVKGGVYISGGVSFHVFWLGKVKSTLTRVQWVRSCSQRWGTPKGPSRCSRESR
jgi:hypothetical protein